MNKFKIAVVINQLMMKQISLRNAFWLNISSSKNGGVWLFYLNIGIGKDVYLKSWVVALLLCLAFEASSSCNQLHTFTHWKHIHYTSFVPWYVKYSLISLYNIHFEVKLKRVFEMISNPNLNFRLFWLLPPRYKQIFYKNKRQKKKKIIEI